jgi:hypothetical protein
LVFASMHAQVSKKNFSSEVQYEPMLPRGKVPELKAPDPFYAGAAFLAWLAKQGGEEELCVCESQWELNLRNHPTPELEDMDLEEYVRLLGPELIIKASKIIKLTPEGSKWATIWAIHYNVVRGHHGGLCLRRY